MDHILISLNNYYGNKIDRLNTEKERLEQTLFMIKKVVMFINNEYSDIVIDIETPSQLSIFFANLMCKFKLRIINKSAKLIVESKINKSVIYSVEVDFIKAEDIKFIISDIFRAYEAKEIDWENCCFKNSY